MVAVIIARLLHEHVGAVAEELPHAHVLDRVRDEIRLPGGEKVVRARRQIDVVPRLLRARQNGGEDRRILEQYGSHVGGIGAQPHRQLPARGVAGHDHGLAHDLRDESAQVIAVSYRAVLLRRLSRASVAVAVDRVHVVSLRQFGEHARVVLPIHRLPVDEQQCRPIVRAFRVVHHRAVDRDPGFGEARSPHLCDASVEVSDVVVDPQPGISAAHDNRRQHSPSSPSENPFEPAPAAHVFIIDDAAAGANTAISGAPGPRAVRRSCSSPAPGHGGQRRPRSRPRPR